MGGHPITSARLASSIVYWVGLVWIGLLVSSRVTGAQVEASSDSTSPSVYWVYVGTYTGDPGRGGSEGIYLLELDLRSGRLSAPRVAAKATNPSFLAVHPNRKLLYSVNEVDSIAGRKGGGVTAFAIDQKDGTLTFLNDRSSIGSGPCHVVVDRSGKNVLAANYGSGSVVCLPVDAEGRLGPETSFIQHRGASVNRQRQQSPHAHSINVDAGNHYAITADLGLDRVLIYRFDAARGTLSPNEPAFAQVAAGSGPRHFAFHPNARFAYVINEMANTVIGFAYDSEKGSLTEIQTISTLPAEFKGRSYTAEVQVHPSGKFLYGSNRGHNSIAIFAIEPESGKLSAAGFALTQGKNPRNFAIDPSGAFLLVENQDSNTIVVFRIDPQTGALQPTGQSVELAKPVCIKMIPKPNA
jgi:6-phosphogluconolactonase